MKYAVKVLKDTHEEVILDTYFLSHSDRAFTKSCEGTSFTVTPPKGISTISYKPTSSAEARVDGACASRS